MQILESSMLGLRTSRMVFRSRDSSIAVTLYPMVHLGEGRFYEETYADAFSHDVALVEGVRSPVVRHLTRSYRWVSVRKLGLVLQPKPPAQEAVSARIVRADLTPEEFHREWRKVSLRVRAAVFVLAPLVGIHRRLFGSRESLARKLSLEDMPAAQEILGWSPGFAPLTHAILHARDARMVECMAIELDSPTGAHKTIAVVYGAMHMRAAISELISRDFSCSESRWRTIFSI